MEAGLLIAALFRHLVKFSVQSVNVADKYKRINECFCGI